MVVRGSDYTYDGDPEAFLLGVEAERIRIAYQPDPLFAVNSSSVDVLPHQVEAVYRYLLPLARVRSRQSHGATGDEVTHKLRHFHVRLRRHRGQRSRGRRARRAPVPAHFPLTPLLDQPFLATLRSVVRKQSSYHYHLDTRTGLPGKKEEKQ